MKPVRLGTRGSLLARAQADQVKAALRTAYQDLPIEIIVIRTTGDQRTDVALSQIGAKGLFVKEIEEALVEGEIELAVHSCKDLPAELHPGLLLAAALPREDPRDALILAKRWKGIESWRQLPSAAVIATGSARRRCQVRALRPDFQFVDLRGNIDTRLRKLDAGEADAIILACAGLNRLQLQSLVFHPFSLDEMVPAVGQGAIVVEMAAYDKALRELAAPLNDPKTEVAIKCERRFLAGMGGGCDLPMGALAELRAEGLVLKAMAASDEFGKLVTGAYTGAREMADQLGHLAAENLRSQLG